MQCSVLHADRLEKMQGAPAKLNRAIYFVTWKILSLSNLSHLKVDLQDLSLLFVRTHQRSCEAV